ncbi:hypothetical protein LRP88_13265 [Fusarium phalaenopsidis]
MGSRDSFVQAEGVPRFWYRDNFFLTNDKSYLCSQTFNQSLDDNWWSSPLPHGQLQKVLNNCLTLAVYWTPQTAEDMKTYLTDVFVVDEFQRRGLASWLMRALKELVNDWKDMRGLLLMTHDQAAARLYRRELGAMDFEKGPSAGLVMLEMPGPAEKPTPKH